MHLIVDGVLRRRVGKEEVERILSDLPAKIEMEILAGPLVVEGRPENPGSTGFVIVDKSHISIHTFEEGDKAAIDVFSCRPFEEENVLRYLEQNIPFKKFNTRMLIRTEE